MAFEDYKRRWKVFPPGAAECATDSEVTFESTSGVVTVRCNGETRYVNGEYKEASDTIEGADYVISMVRCIKLIPKGPKVPIAGSWTAEDNGPWIGDD